ncbi:hypothetical protein ACOSP7_020253 [Xanthoceras sorbifolium]
MIIANVGYCSVGSHIRTRSCCKSMPISCWQHCIEEVKLEITNENCKEVSDIKRFSSEGAAGIYEKIDGLCGFGG